MVKPLSIGIVGTGAIHRKFAEAAKLVEGVSLHSVFSRKSDTGAAFAAENGIESAFSDWKSFLADPMLDAVYVASPILFHERQTLDALDAGKHVFCEKSIATDTAAFLRMKKKAEEKGRVLLEAMRPDFDPAIDLLREYLPKLGRIESACFEYCQYSSRYDAFLAGRVENAFEPALKNSALSDIGVYPLHLCLSLFGFPEKICAESRFLSNRFEGEGTLRLGYSDFEAQIVYSKIRNSERNYPTVLRGEHATLYLDRINAPENILFEERGKAPIRLPYEASKPSNLTHEIMGFLSAVLGNITVKPLLAVTEMTMRVMDEAVRQTGMFG